MSAFAEDGHFKTNSGEMQRQTMAEQSEKKKRLEEPNV